MDSGLAWRVWYEDGSTFSNTDGMPEDSPAWGVVAIAQRTEGAYQDALYSGVPWYCFRTDVGYWVEVDNTGYLDLMVHNAKSVSVVRPGRYIARDVFFERRKALEAWLHG